MKCLLLNSPIYRNRTEVEEEYLPPLGLGYIATHIKDSGVDVEIVDCVRERLGVSEIFALLKTENVEYFGINIFTQNFETVKEIVEHCPVKVKIIIGGQAVKSTYSEILTWNVSNELILVVGEGEFLLPAVIKGTCVEQPITRSDRKSVYRVDKGSYYFPRDLSAVHLDRSLLKGNVINNHYNQREASIITSRGCIYNCAFCGGARDLNKNISTRFRNISDVDREIDEIISIYSEVSSIRVLDDLFLRDKKSIEMAIDLFERHKSVTWRGMAHVLTFSDSSAILPKLRASGCNELFIGIESGSIQIRQKINKPGTPEILVRVVTDLLQAGIDVKGYFMYGFPSETEEDAKETYELAFKLNSIAQGTKGVFRQSVFQFRPYHGTQLYNQIIEDNHVMNPIKQNINLNVVSGRSQFNFHSGNYSKMCDNVLEEFIIKTQKLSDV